MGSDESATSLPHLHSANRSSCLCLQPQNLQAHGNSARLSKLRQVLSAEHAFLIPLLLSLLGDWACSASNGPRSAPRTFLDQDVGGPFMTCSPPSATLPTSTAALDGLNLAAACRKQHTQPVNPDRLQMKPAFIPSLLTPTFNPTTPAPAFLPAC